MTIEDFVTHEINEYQTDNVREIIDYHDISIEYNDQLNKACDSSISNCLYYYKIRLESFI